MATTSNAALRKKTPFHVSIFAKQTTSRMTEQNPPPQPFAWPVVRTFGVDAPWRWLRAGTADLAGAPVASLFYGLLLSVMGFLLVRYNAGAIGLAFATGFLIVGPLLAIGLYDISRRRELGERVDLAPTLTAWDRNFAAIGFFALIMALLLAVWIRVSVVVVALFFPDGVPALADFVAHVAKSPEAWVFILAYFAAGGGLALFVFAIAAVSLPMLLDRERMDVISAMITSFNVLRKNFAPMLLWAGIVVVFTAIGFATWFVGLVVAMPIIGHATWHAYRDAVERAPG